MNFGHMMTYAVRKLTLFHDYMLLAMSGFQIKSNPKKSLESSLF